MTDPLSDTTRMIDDWERDAARKAARFQAMAQQVEQISITESVADGAVSATVGHNGIPTDIAMTDRVREMTPREIAANVMAAIRKAQSRYPERLSGILAETVGEDDPAAQHILATAVRSFPPPEEPSDAEDPTRFADVEDDLEDDVEDRAARRRARPAPRADGGRDPADSVADRVDDTRDDDPDEDGSTIFRQ